MTRRRAIKQSSNQFKKTRKATPKETLLLLFNKPFNTLCQFTGEAGDSTLADYISTKNVYPAGRLDKDSEGLLLLTNNGPLQHKISHPKYKQPKTYWVQVEGEITEEALNQLCKGVVLKDGLTKPANARSLNLEQEDLQLWDRDPPVRFRKNIPTSWIELTIKEGKNRQVRRMTAAVGFPTLRLVRVAVGDWWVDGLAPGEFKVVSGSSF
ncbi:pseudouridine synthase [Aliikangiella coralliicola]|uniref:Pseudouridine synthase n=1 Tax=Aliikangiella coralliicola TaxID=2592383 RepID=A0A545UDJ5_9GAMM|nr:pseudouridine synthase [Aliikangiella coralliicola]